ncbi:MAG: asparagine synthase (glutamine-hydrolyzing), partial [Deltaproteobacteria bacterium]|nr:asparagine synthase (glutamine-hydrolyzing) [Deltaproteobacteria bacterium]
MCGIAGFINARAPEDQQRVWVQSMMEALVHRGPDEGGLWVEAPAALGHRRLSVIDIQGGRQPMADRSGQAVVVHNGEIYNFMDIRRDLESKGRTFLTRSDTEVLLSAYLDLGVDCLDAFEGMFAFALWDRKRRRLFAARDRMGKKPFYYTYQKGVFAFSSELTALARLPFIDLEVDRRSMARFLAYEYVPTPHTIYRNVYKLRPGHFLVLSKGRITISPYWDLPVPERRQRATLEDYKEELRFLARRAVKRRLVSDVPLGVFLSGGIDSSAVAALMTDHVPSGNVKTFSIGFQERSYDESPYARLVARTLQTDHHEETLSALRAGEMLPLIVSRLDEPMSDPSIVPTYFLSQVTRRKVTVALGGDGGDELFAGYEHFLGFLVAQKYGKIPVSIRARLLEPLCKRLPLSTGYVSPGHIVERFLSGARQPPWLRTQMWLGAFSPDMQKGLWEDLPQGVLEPDNLFEETRLLYERFPAEEAINKVFYLFARQYLLDYILVKVDRCSMMHSLEVRAPFLDKDVVEFAFALPWWLKIRHG